MELVYGTPCSLRKVTAELVSLKLTYKGIAMLESIKYLSVTAAIAFGTTSIVWAWASLVGR
jgi:hypothetical protein